MYNNKKNAIYKFKEAFELYKLKDFHSTCIQEILCTLRVDGRTIVEPHKTNKELNDFFLKLHNYIVSELKNYNTFEILKSVMIWEDMIRFKEFNIT